MVQVTRTGRQAKIEQRENPKLDLASAPVSAQHQNLDNGAVQKAQTRAATLVSNNCRDGLSQVRLLLANFHAAPECQAHQARGCAKPANYALPPGGTNLTTTTISMGSLPTLRRCAMAHCRRPTRFSSPIFLDFLAPSALRHRRRYASTATGSSGDSKPRYVLSKQQREYLDSALRVNQAGELAATLIYTSQTPQIVRSHPHLRSLMKHMYDQEAAHFKTFNHLIAKHEIRPTAMYPIWEMAATFLGWSTAALGREAAMACTEAVETEIGSHYNDQVREILSWEADAERRGEKLDDELKEMLSMLRRVRDEELEHLDHAVANDSKEAKPYDPLVDIIRLGCRTAIRISEKV